MKTTKSKAITIPLRLTSKDIKFLVEELNNLESSRLTEFIEEILKLADSISDEMNNAALEIRKVNPFSQQHKEESHEKF